MKTFRLQPLAFSLQPLALSLALISLISGGCGKKETTSDAAFKSATKAARASAEPNSFKEVSAFLDAGGPFYLYLGTEQWLNGLSTRLTDLREALGSLPNMSAKDRANVRKLVDVVAGLVKTSGLEDVSGVGASGIMVEKGMYHNKTILHHYPGKNQGFLWSAFGKAPHPLTGLDYLPESTALASFFDVDVPTLWNAIQEQVQAAAIPEADQFLTQLPVEFEKRTGLKLDQVMASLGGEIGVALTLDETRDFTFPSPAGASVSLPEPALALLIKVKDETIFNRLDQLMSMNKQVVKTDKDGFKMRTLPLPIPVPVRPTVAQGGGYLFLASHNKIVEDLLAAKSGKAKGLKSTDEFKRLSKDIVLEGNRFDFVSARFMRTIQHVVSTALFNQAQAGRNDPGAQMLQRLLGDAQDRYSFSVASNLKEGWYVCGNGTTHPVATLLGPSVAIPAIAAGVALPALAKAKSRAQSVNCVNNLKQIGLAARMYANDHGDVLPKDFPSMKNELSSTKILICPGDKTRTQTPDWNNFDPANISYEIVAPGVNTSDPSKVYVRCRVHDNVCLVDGSVQQNRPSRRSQQ